MLKLKWCSEASAGATLESGVSCGLALNLKRSTRRHFRSRTTVCCSDKEVDEEEEEAEEVEEEEQVESADPKSFSNAAENRAMNFWCFGDDDDDEDEKELLPPPPRFPVSSTKNFRCIRSRP